MRKGLYLLLGCVLFPLVANALDTDKTMSEDASEALHKHSDPVVLAPGYADLQFIPPAAGKYRLPPMGRAENGEILDTTGARHRLHEYFGDKLVVMSFIYTTCSDVNGCPLASHVFRKLQERLLDDKLLRSQVRLLSFSFDPAHDTPEVLGEYSKFFKDDNFDWQFLTTPSEQELDPILADYGQWVIRDYDDSGRYMGSMSHVLRVFLIDRAKRIRNIYSVSFLHADTVANDLRTLLLEE